MSVVISSMMVVWLGSFVRSIPGVEGSPIKCIPLWV